MSRPLCLRTCSLSAIVIALVGVSLGACSAPGSSAPPPASSTGDDSGTGDPTSGGDDASTPTIGSGLSLPFTVSTVFVPSGFMGDTPTDFNAVKMSSAATACPSRAMGAQGSCYSVNWTPAPISGQKTAWVGVYWQYPGNNWGGKPGKDIAAGATKVTFSAMGGAGGEALQFLAGGVNVSGGNASLTYADTFTAKAQVTLTNAWADYEVDLTGDTYSQVIGAFAWTMTTGATDPVTFYIDNIQWQ
ncbi:MAG TPA: hypothetical protein VGI39_30145 [Polyangiaceae bacterium]|jgi:hypothetical protein